MRCARRKARDVWSRLGGGQVVDCVFRDSLENLEFFVPTQADSQKRRTAKLPQNRFNFHIVVHFAYYMPIICNKALEFDFISNRLQRVKYIFYFCLILAHLLKVS